jgi:dihydrofolate synthase/folylpolyglutamate synthase
LGLERIGALLQELGNPQENCRCVLVAGSNGKGSTVEMIGAILRAGGARVGTYFSPQVVEFPERIRVGGRNAGKKEIAAAYCEVRTAADAVAPEATFFEVVTAMALVIFARRGVEFAVLEVGLGGRLDAANAVEPEVSVLTSLSLEHTDVLGNTIERIAHEKCGIARGGRPLVCGKVSSEAARAVEKECKKRGAGLIFADSSCLPARPSAPGKFQLSNAAVAAEACRLLGAGKREIARGLRAARPAFRLERRGNLLLDCCHNPEAASALAAEVGGMEARGNKVLLFSAMKDKDYAEVLRVLAPQLGEAVVAEVKLARGEKAGKIAAAARKAGMEVSVVKDSKKALAFARRRAGKNGLCVVAGSIYLLAELYGRDKIRVAQ